MRLGLFLFSAVLASPSMAAEGPRSASSIKDALESSVQWNCELMTPSGKSTKLSGKLDPVIVEKVKASGPPQQRDIRIKNNIEIDQTGYFTEALETRVNHRNLFFVSRYELKISDNNSIIKLLEFDFGADDGIGFVALKSTDRKSKTDFGETSFEDTSTVEAIGFCQYYSGVLKANKESVEIEK